MITSCVHNDEPKSEIIVIVDGLEEKFLACNYCIEYLQLQSKKEFTIIQVVSQ